MALAPVGNAEKGGRGFAKSVWNTDVRELFLGRQAGKGEIARFCRKLGFLLGSGLSAKDSLRLMGAGDSAGGFGAVVGSLHTMVGQGRGLSDALFSTQAFPPFLCGSVGVGEKTGRLADSFARLADYYEERAALDEELFAAALYPALIFVMMLAVSLFAVFFVLPGYAEIFAGSGAALPPVTAGLLSASDFFARNIAFLLPGAAAASACAAACLRSGPGRMLRARLALRLPLAKKAVNLRIAEALAMLLESGIGVAEALPLCARLAGNPCAEADLAGLEADIRRGAPFWQSLGKLPYADRLFVELAKVGEDCGRLGDAMSKCSAYMRDEYRRGLKRLNKTVEPLTTLALGAMLVFIVLAVVMPTFELAGVM